MKIILFATLIFSNLAFAEIAPFVSIHSGFNTCTTDSQGNPTPFSSKHGPVNGTRLINTLNKTLKNSRSSWLFSCFDKIGNLFYTSSRHPRKAQRVDITNIKPLINEYVALSNDLERPILAMGHSYGGWLAIKVLARLPRKIKQGLLVTLDPISYTQCSPLNYAKVIGNFLGGYGYSAIRGLEPCQRSPVDITTAELKQMRYILADNRWKNYFQTNFYPLHSDSFNRAYGPDYSRNLSPFLSKFPSGVHPSWNAHGEILNLSAVWYGVKIAMTNFIKN
jgi:pimeloyl-ACP methyl ester carboxylesterase